MESFKVRSLDDLPDVAEAILGALGGRTVVAFRGGMGAGKTTLIREICRRLGVTDTVSSPTFAIVNEYRGEGIAPVYHFDFYRGNLCLVEWPEKVESLLPDDTMTVRIDTPDEDVRIVAFD